MSNEKCTFNIDRAVLAFAGCVVLVSLALAQWVHPYWVWLAVFAACNMIQASITGFSPAAILFRALGVKEGLAFPRKE